jgi:hypothetical protein
MCLYHLPLIIGKSIIYIYVHVRTDERRDPGEQRFNSPVTNEGIGDNE